MPPQNNYLLNLLLENDMIQLQQAESVCAYVVDEVELEHDVAVYHQLIDCGYIKEAELLMFLAEVEGVEYEPRLELVREKINSSERSTSDYPIFDWGRNLLIEENSRELTIGTRYPVDYQFVEELRCRFQKKVRIILLKYKHFDELYSIHPVHFQVEENSIKYPKTKEESHEFSREHDLGVVEYFEHIIQLAIQRNASDIHFESLKDNAQVRYRIDGHLVKFSSVQKSVFRSIIARIKILSDLDISEFRQPQDGRFNLDYQQKKYDFRVSVIPALHGESASIRILDKNETEHQFCCLGMTDLQVEVFKQIIHRKNGMFLITGPTGSGKTTTLYTALQYLNSPDDKITTVEDPIEFDIDGINQIQVNHGVGLCFSTALRSILRQSPDTIMIGEIRDVETMNIAINASLTGHRVLSTLHTNDACGAIARLYDMGAKPYLLSSSICGVMAQRLLRFIEPSKRVSYRVTDWEIEAFQGQVHSGDVFFRAGRDGNDFNGRIGVFELFEVNDEIAELIHDGTFNQKIRDCLEQQEFQTMRTDALNKARLGFTSLEEVLALTMLNKYY